MNFLAHLYLSENNTNILIGNFIADHIKGNQFHQFSKEIQQGVFLHRKIDTYTDKHEVVRKSKKRLHQRYCHYDGVIIDIFYDYFLAKNWAQYSAIPLGVYANSIYQLLQDKIKIVPLKSKEFITYMIRYNLLYNYQFLESIEQVLNGMNRRTLGKSKMHLAINDLKDLETEFEQDFTLFFKDLRNFCHQEILNLKI